MKTLVLQTQFILYNSLWQDYASICWKAYVKDAGTWNEQKYQIIHMQMYKELEK